MAPPTAPTDSVLEDLAEVVGRLWQAADLAFDAAGPDGDLELDLLSITARDAAWTGADLMGAHRSLCNTVGVSAASDPLELIRAAEQVLASRPIEQWPPGTSRLVVDVCDLIGEYAR